MGNGSHVKGKQDKYIGMEKKGYIEKNKQMIYIHMIVNEMY